MTREIVFECTPHPGQMALLYALSQQRFTLACCGRRWGKTWDLKVQMAREAVENPYWKAWWVDPSLSQAERIYFELKRELGQLITDSHDTRRRLVLFNGAVMEFHSSEQADSLLGEGLDRLMINEASLVKERVWKQILRPMLTDRKGRGGFAFTPRGQGHWTYPMWLKGQKPEEHKGYASLQFPTSSNPNIDPEEIEFAREDIPEDVFRQEYLAEFLEDSAGVFRGLSKVISGKLDTPNSVPTCGPYAASADIARVTDWTVISVIDRHGRLVWRERFNKLDWKYQRERIVFAAKRYKAPLWLDATGLGGDMMAEDLADAGVTVVPVTFTNASKKDMVHGLQMAIERQTFTVPAECADVIEELSIFQYDVSPSGLVRYNAPQGMHDDCVDSVMLAWLGHQEVIKGKHASTVPDGVDDMFKSRRAA